ncbi:MAG: RNA methyltransferase [Bacteroidales bacterium]
MISKADIKFIKSLSLKKFRDEHRMFIIEGEKMVEEAEKSGFEFVYMLRKEDIGEENMERISLLSSPSPVLAVVKMKDAQRITTDPSKLYLALDSVRDPGNLGTIIRLAEWFGIDAVIASEDCAELYNPKVVQATMGAIFRKKIIYTDLKKFLSDRSGEYNIYGTFLDAPSIYEHSITPTGIIVMGSESHGISKEIEHEITQKLYIPPYPADSNGSESLNVAIATAVVCSEFRRISALQLQTSR